ncbi:DUF4232 domain-containing protein [Streptomyces sp. L2]|uniref:DUF4232 domain-containing protein n=1 Tax=Streptomyces sp. L2 TaxID=2162665 RepID=UPI001012A649|nr:DUF4232 domain-containing protein [Streptomyces sp. L2]
MSSHSRHRSRRIAATALTIVSTGGVAAGAAQATADAQASAVLRTCTVNDLYLSMGRKEVAAGSLYWPITFTNTSTTRCALRGYPGVSVLDTAHRQIGLAASASGRPYTTVVLAPARSAAAVIRTSNGPLGGPCLTTGIYLRVYPPASYQAVLVPAPWKICSALFQVGPVNIRGTF